MKGRAKEDCFQKMRESYKRLQKLTEESEWKHMQFMWGRLSEEEPKFLNCINEWAQKYAVVSEEPVSVLVEVVASRCQLSGLVNLLESGKKTGVFLSTLPVDQEIRDKKASIARIIVETRAAAREQPSAPPRPKDRGA